MKEWMSSQKFTGELQEALLQAEFMYAPNDKWPDELKEQFRDLKSHSSLLFTAIEDPGTLDTMWSAFFASGNTDYSWQDSRSNAKGS